MATSDSLVASIAAKYHYNFWRALFPELSVGSRQRQQRRRRNPAPDLRRGRPRDIATYFYKHNLRKATGTE